MNRVRCAHFVLASVGALSACSIWPLGEDPRGRERLNAVEPIVDALVRHERETGTLPTTLNQLVPNYLAAGQLGSGVNYSQLHRSLEVTYTPTWPAIGRVSCSRTIGDAKWHCLGYV
jgi:hypothetical protein